MFVKYDEFKNGIHSSCTGVPLQNPVPEEMTDGCHFSQWDTATFTVVEVNSDGSEYVFARRNDLDKEDRLCVRLALHESYGNLCVHVEAQGSERCTFKYENQNLEFHPLNRTIDHVKAMVEIVCQELSLEDL